MKNISVLVICVLVSLLAFGFEIQKVEEMDFRSFMMEGIDGEFTFSQGRKSRTREEFAKNIADSDDAPSEKDEVVLIECLVAKKVKNRKVSVSSKAVDKRKHAAYEPSDPLDIDSDPDIHEFPSAKELKDFVDCHWVVAHVTPPSWKHHLKAIILDKLCDIHDKAYIRQVVLDNVMNRRTRELMSTLSEARAACDAIR
ncbi:hypothetical protein Tco_1039567 [Tanacetum coccineum]